MTELQRLKKVVKWMISEGYGTTQKEIGEILGYTNESSFSQILSGKVKTDTLIKKIYNFDRRISKDWLLYGEGEMLKEDNKREEPKEFISEVTPVPEDAYMMVEYADLSASAGYLGGGNINDLPEQSRRLLPREYERGHYLVVRVSGDSMNDGTARSLFDGDEILIKQVYMDSFTKSLPIRKSLFVITSRDGNVLKQITEFNYEEGYLVCHSFNPNYSDFRIQLGDVYQIFQVCKIVQKQISLM